MVYQRSSALTINSKVPTVHSCCVSNEHLLFLNESLSIELWQDKTIGIKISAQLIEIECESSETFIRNEIIWFNRITCWDFIAQHGFNSMRRTFWFDFNIGFKLAWKNTMKTRLKYELRTTKLQESLTWSTTIEIMPVLLQRKN